GGSCIFRRLAAVGARRKPRWPRRAGVEAARKTRPGTLVPFNIADWLFSPALIDTAMPSELTWPDPLIPRLSTVIAGERPNALRSGSGPAGRLLSAYLNVKRAGRWSEPTIPGVKPALSPLVALARSDPVSLAGSSRVGARTHSV